MDGNRFYLYEGRKQNKNLQPLLGEGNGNDSKEGAQLYNCNEGGDLSGNRLNAGEVFLWKCKEFYGNPDARACMGKLDDNEGGDLYRRGKP